MHRLSCPCNYRYYIADYYITDKEFPFADEVREDTTILELNELYEMYQRLPDGIREEYREFLAYYENLEELYNYRNEIIPYPDCKSMIDVAKQKTKNDPDFRDLSEDCQEYYFDYGSLRGIRGYSL